MTPDDPFHQPQEAPPPTPRWVKTGAVVGAVLLVVLVLVALLGGSEHGPGRHVPAENKAAEATCDTERYDNPGGTGARVSCTNVTGNGERVQAFACNDPSHGGVQLEWDISGDLRVKVHNAQGTEVLSMSHTGAGSDSRDFGAEGPGEWNLTVERAGDFAGSFSVSTFCAR